MGASAERRSTIPSRPHRDRSPPVGHRQPGSGSSVRRSQVICCVAARFSTASEPPALNGCVDARPGGSVHHRGASGIADLGLHLQSAAVPVGAATDAWLARREQQPLPEERRRCPGIDQIRHQLRWAQQGPSVRQVEHQLQVRLGRRQCGQAVGAFTATGPFTARLCPRWPLAAAWGWPGWWPGSDPVIGVAQGG